MFKRSRSHPDRPVPLEPAPLIDLDDASFVEQTVGRCTVVDFWAPWCGPCRSFHPVFEDLARSFAAEPIQFARCDVDQSPETAALLQILSIPTVVVFGPNGSEVARVTGVPQRAVVERLVRESMTDAETA